MQTLVELLRAVAGSGEIVAIGYNAGSRPGAVREVVPLRVSGSELVATDPNSDVEKRYKLEFISSLQLSSGESVENPAVRPAAPRGPVWPDVPTFETLREYADHFVDEFRAAGWYVHRSETLLGVGGFYKNGNPRKSPSISIWFSDRSTETVFDWESGEMKSVIRQLTGRERPWSVMSSRPGSAKSLSRLPDAFAAFLAEVRAASPSAS
jgi:hypothetical protein